MKTGPVMILAGGTGGHIFPGLAVATELKEMSVPVVWMGGRRGLEKTLVPAAGITLECVAIEGIRGKGFWGWVKAPFKVLLAVSQARKIIRKHAPRSVLSMGGYAAAPGGLAAWIAGIPLYIHEQNRIPGLTNKLLFRLARRVFSGFPDSFPNKKHVVYCGNPVRREIFETANEAPGQPLNLLVLGGSQGARSLNQLVPAALASLPLHLRPDVVHQMGSRLLDEGKAAYDSAEIAANLVDFIDDMAGAYQWADLVIARAGALTVAEISAAGVASVLVPFPHAVDDHQTANAAYLAHAGAASILQETDLRKGDLGPMLQQLFLKPQKLQEMAQAALSLRQHNAAKVVASFCAGEVQYAK